MMLPLDDEHISNVITSLLSLYIICIAPGMTNSITIPLATVMKQNNAVAFTKLPLTKCDKAS